MYSVFRQAEPTARANVASWANGSRECTWHSLAFSRSILPPLGCFTAPFSGLRPRCGSWANVASWVHESRECTWAFIGSSSVSSPSSGVLYRFIHRLPPAPWVRGPMQLHRPTKPANVRGHSPGSSSVSSPSAGGALPHSLVPALPDLFPRGYGFFRRKAFVPTMYSVFRQAEPTARAMSLRGQTNPAKVRGHSPALPL